MLRRLRDAAIFTALIAAAASASAQPAAGSGGRLEVGAAVRWTSASSLGGAAAALTPNAGQPPYTLFDVSGDLGAHAGAEVRVGYRVLGGLRLSADASLARPSVEVRIRSDAEGAPDRSFAGESLLQWTLGGRADCDMHRLRFMSGRAVPFVSARAGMLWQSHEGRVSTDSGWYAEAGGGVAFTLRTHPSSRLSRVGIAADLRVSHVGGGFNWGQDARTMPSFGVGVTTGWGRARKAA
jgi:hypothetical protein